jgi:hypothetical protein
MIFMFLFIALVIGVLIVAALMPARHKVKKVTTINRSLGEVVNKVGDLNYYVTWNPWQQAEPSATKTVTGTPNTIGHQYSWHGKKVGTGTLTVKSIGENYIHFDLEFIKPWKSHAKDDWLFEKGIGNETKVTWQNSASLPWPMGRLMGPIINKNLDHIFEKRLDNLKRMVEES